MDNVTHRIDRTSVYTCCVPHFSVNTAVRYENASAEMMHRLAGWSENVCNIPFSSAFLLLRLLPWNHDS